MRATIFAACLVASACVTAPELKSDPLLPADGSATLTRENSSSYTLTYRFSKPQSALVFGQAPLSYRAGNWTSLTDGAEVQAIGKMDALIFNEPATEASFRFAPSSENLPKAYTAFIPYTTGDHGVLTGQFRLMRADSRAAIEAFDQTANDWGKPDLVLDLTISSESPIWIHGTKHDGEVTLRPGGDDTYAFVGDLEPVEGESFVGFVDPGLPAWVADGFDANLVRIFSELTEGWGKDLPEKSTVLFGFHGLDGQGLNLTGGALDGGVLALEAGGEALTDADPGILTYLQWFFAHEAAHLYQKMDGGAPDDPLHAWIHEGSANTMAHDVAASFAEDPEAFLMEVYTSAYGECVTALEKGALTDAVGRGDFGALYACGDFMGLITDAGLPDHSLYDFWNRYKEVSDERGDRGLNHEAYFDTLERLGASQAAMKDIRTLALEPVENPSAFLKAALERSGLGVTLSEDGTPLAFRLRADGDRKALMRRATISG